MRTRFLFLAFFLIALTTGCKDCQKAPKSPALLKSLPAGAQILFQVDGRSFTATYGAMMNNLSGMLPDEQRKEIPSWDEIVAKAKEPTGIDLNQIGLVLAASYFDKELKSRPRMAVIAEGLNAEDLLGSQDAEHLRKPRPLLQGRGGLPRPTPHTG